jgi:hypothetical protein
MKYHIATRYGFLHGSRIAQIACHSLSIQFLDIPEIAAGPYQQSETGSLFGQDMGHVAADKASSACDES